MKTQTPLKDPNDRQKINYTALFGCFIIKVISDSKENAKIAVLNKFNSFKDGGTKKEYIRAKITTEDFKVWTDRELIYSPTTKGRKMNKTLAIYREGDTNIQDTVNNDTGLTTIYRKSVKDYPGCQIVPMDYACDRINEALKDKYPMLCPVEITEEQFYEMFECLPPMHIGKTPDGWSFKMSEMTFNDITSGYVCKGDKYYQMNCRLKTKAEEMIAVCA